MLGPLEVTGDGRQLGVGSPTERHLLAILVCLGNEVVPVGRLIDELWGEDPPVSAPNMVRRGVSRLRGVMGDPSGERLVTEAGGYRLRIGEGESDRVRFEQLVARAGRSRDPAERASLLEEALGLWRGIPLGGAGDGPTVTAERVRLEKARLAALENRIEAELRSGHHRDLVFELEALVGQHPLRDRLRAQLMLALYRCDRQAEALAAYQQLSTLLGQELGIEPSVHLQHLEEQIRFHDPELEREATTQHLAGGSAATLSRHEDRRLAAVMFVDMVGFTALMQENEQLGLEKRTRYRRVLEAQHEVFGGRIVQYYGDGALSIFPNSVDAVVCAVEIQKELSQPVEVPARIGIHVGEVIVEPTGVVGDAVNIASRIESFGIPGGVLVSDSVHDQIRNQPQLGFINLGRFKLDNVDRAFEILAVSSDGLEVPAPGVLEGKGERIMGPPSPTADSAAPTNLPHRLTTFIGRETELATIQDLIAAHRLVTLTGAGGIGKTSLAVRAAAELVDSFPEGVWFIDLALLTDDVQLPGAVAGLFDIKGIPAQDITAALVRHLAPMETLLVLDNCEHLIDGAAELADTFLGATERVRVLATSREALRLDGEALLRVPPLDVPPTDATVDEAVEVAAVMLFADRARLARSDFTLTGGAGAAVVEICRRLDGIPLAIELAAARIDTLTATQIADRLDDRFRLLTRGSRTALPRQQTLRGAVEWSHDLLTEPERALFRRLGVFGGSFTLEAAQQIGAYEPLDIDEVSDGLDRLVETSLLSPPGPDTGRYRIMETIRAYARSLLESKLETDTTMRRLAEYLLEAGPATSDGLAQSDLVEWLRWRADEQDNFRAALNWARSAADRTLCGTLAVEFSNYLAFAGLDAEADAWVESALDLQGDESTHLQLRLLTLLAAGAITRGDVTRAQPLIDSLLTDAEVFGEEATAAFALALKAELTHQRGELESALALNTQAIERLLAVGDPRFVNPFLTGAEILSDLGRYDEAEALVARLEPEHAERVDTRYASLMSNLWRGKIATYRGDYERAIELLRSCLEPFGPIEMGSLLLDLGLAEFGRGNLEAAGRLVRRGLSFEQMNIADTSHWILVVRGLAELEGQNLRTAALHLGDAIDVAATRGLVLEREAVLTAVAEAVLEADRPAEAAIFLAAAEAARARVNGLVPKHWVRQHNERVAEQLRRTLEAVDLQQLSEEGKRLSYEQAAQRALAILDEFAPKG